MKNISKIGLITCTILGLLIIRELVTPKPCGQGSILTEYEALTQAANNYVTVLNKIGSRQHPYQSEKIMPLCTRNCRKVRNGKLLFAGKEHFAAQLDAGKKWLGFWSINVQEIITSTDNRAVTIRYQLSTEKEGDLVIIVILHFDSDYLIDEINEVHNRLEA